MNSFDEKTLIEKAKNDPQAFGQLYSIYYSRILNYVIHRTASVATAQDITSEVFYKVMTQLHRFQWRDIPFSVWVYKIASNEVANSFRSKEKKFYSLEWLTEKKHFEPVGVNDLEQEIVEAEEDVFKHHNFIKVHTQLLNLPLLYQEVIVLRFFEKKKIAEISEITGKNINTIKSLLARGIVKLREKVFSEIDK
ncbi:sigma-70 family RNA polymerase sigma factor [Candidatus Roizmanbacteria bacterium]|nr:sigma-70 family RNA polymerase sigma factor [Candidatus Roizmanbacteria bacterium]